MEQFLRDYFKLRSMGHKPYAAARAAASDAAWFADNKRKGY